MKSILHLALIIGLFPLSSFALMAQEAMVKGRIFDLNTNEPIPFANVLVVGTNTGTVSDEDGNFVISGINPGYVVLQASFVGYEVALSRDVLVSNAKTQFVEIGLTANEYALEEVTVKIDPFEKREEAPVSLQRIGIKEIESNPGSNRDISRVIQSFPGVGSTPAFRNDVIVRGGGPSENRFFLDDVEIPVLNHFATQGASGGPVGIINADFISSVNYYSGAFPADRYNALSGMFEFTQLDGNPDKVKFRGTLGASEVSATLDGPIGEKSSFIFSARRSYLQFLFSAIGLPFLPTFNDYQMKFKSRINKKNEITVVSIGSLDNLTLNDEIEEPDASQEYILTQIPVNNQWSYTFGVVWKHFLKNGYSTAVLSRNMLNNQFYKYPDNDESRPKSFDYLSTEAENKFRYEIAQTKNTWKWNYGVNSEYAKYYNRTSQQVYENGSSVNFQYDSNLELVKYGAFAQLSKRFIDLRTSVSFGVRADGNNYNDEMSNLFNQLSPRLSLSFAPVANTTVSASTGRFYQLPAYTTLGFRNEAGDLVNENVDYIGANHYVIGVEQKWNSAYLFSVEGFYKDYFQYPINLLSGSSLANSGADYSSVSGAVPVRSSGAGRATGFEVLSRVNKPGFNLIASYTFVRSLFTDVNGTEIPSSWDSRHLLTITGTKSLKRNWTAGLKWRFVGGLPYTPYDLEKSANVEAWDAIGGPYYDFDRLNEERFSPFHQLDVRVDKRYFFNKWSLMFYLDIQNVYNFQNKGQDYIVREKDASGDYIINNGEYILSSIENYSGTVLPTIGIMVEF